MSFVDDQVFTVGVYHPPVMAVSTGCYLSNLCTTASYASFIADITPSISPGTWPLVAGISTVSGLDFIIMNKN